MDKGFPFTVTRRYRQRYTGQSGPQITFSSPFGHTNQATAVNKAVKDTTEVYVAGLVNKQSKTEQRNTE